MEPIVGKFGTQRAGEQVSLALSVPPPLSGVRVGRRGKQSGYVCDLRYLPIAGHYPSSAALVGLADYF